MMLSPPSEHPLEGTADGQPAAHPARVGPTLRAWAAPGLIATIRESDLAVIEKLIESDSITGEMYQERLDEILQIGHEADKEVRRRRLPRRRRTDAASGTTWTTA